MLLSEYNKELEQSKVMIYYIEFRGNGDKEMHYIRPKILIKFGLKFNTKVYTRHVNIKHN